MLLFFGIMVAALGFRLYRIQITHGELFARAAVIRRSPRFVYATGRGQILDRNGESLLDTRYGDVLVTFGQTISEDAQTVFGSGEPDSKNYVHVLRGLTHEEAERLEQQLPPSVLRVQEEQRYGPKSLAPHIVGYVRRTLIPRHNPLAGMEEKPMFLEMRFTGEKGLERVFDKELSAPRPSVVAAFLDGRGNLVPGFGYRDIQYDDPRRPYNVVTTLDRRIQAAVEKIGRNGYPISDGGAIVVMEAGTGDILAMGSFPDFSSEAMFSGVSKETYNTFDFNNRAISGYAPGSVFKVTLAAAALEKNLPEPDGHFLCTGSYKVGNSTISCYEGRAHGVVDLHEALVSSCNGYFADLALRLGRDTVTGSAVRFHLGKKTNIPLGSESAGNIPLPETLPNPGDVANVSVGQGKVLTTPLQLARLMATIANDGVDVYPRLVSEITDKNGRNVRRYPVYRQRVLSPAVSAQLKAMLTDVVESGTARDAHSPLYTAAGKSGTAESTTPGSHSWFAGFVRSNGRNLAIAVFIEKWERDTGQPRAAAIFRQVAEAILTSEQ